MDNYDVLVSLYTLYVSLLLYENLSDDEEEMAMANHRVPVSKNNSPHKQSTINARNEEKKIQKNQIVPTGVRKVIIKKKNLIDPNKKKRKRSIWVRVSNLDRNQTGYFVKTFETLKERDPNGFFQHTRMSRTQYDNLLDLITEGLTKKSMRPAISVDCRLAITLSYLSQGVSQSYLSETFKVGRSSIREIILETCAVIWSTLGPTYVCEPSVEDYLISAKKLYEDFAVPNCVGAVDAKYFQFACPPRKGVHKELTMELLAASDPFYCFTYVGVSLYNEDTDFESKILNDGFILPEDTHLPGSDIIFPHYFVGNTNFPLKEHIMRPYPEQRSPLDDKQTYFNRRLSKVFRVLENTIGVLVARWKVLQTNLHYLPENIKTIVLATIALHNYIRKTSAETNEWYCPDDFVDWEDSDGNLHLGNWRQEVQVYFKSGKLGSNNSAKYAIALRDQLAEYFYKETHYHFANIGVADPLEFLPE